MNKDKPVLVRNSNVSLVTSRGCEAIFRIIGHNDSHVFALRLGTAILTSLKAGGKKRTFTAAPPSEHIRDRIVWPREFVEDAMSRGKLLRVAEHGHPEQMNELAFPLGTNSQLDLRRQVVAFIDVTWGDRILSDRRAQAESVKVAADRFSVDEDSVRKWIQRHLFYGKHENALVDHNWLKGAPEVSRLNLKDADGRPIRCGRPPKTQGTFKKKGHQVLRLTGHLLAEYTNFIKEQAYDTDDSFPIIFLRWTLSRVATTRDKEGHRIYVPINPRILPSDQNMKIRGRKLLKEFRDEREAKKPVPTGSKGGSVHDILHDQLPVLQIDGTTADNFLLYGNHRIKIEGRGKPTVLLGVCPHSSAIVGWHVTFGAENGDGYRRCVFNAAIPKTRILMRWKVSHLKGFVYGCASEVFTDRGPGISMATTTSLVGRFRMHASMAAPGTPPAKGPAEEVMGYFQTALAEQPGSIKKTGDQAKDRTRRLTAPDGAISMERFMQALLTAISRRNLLTNASHLLTPDHMKGEISKPVMGSPAEIYKANKLARTGDASWDFAPDDVFRRLCEEKTRKVNRDGLLRHGTHDFSSNELKLFARSYARLHGGASVSIKYYVIPDAPFLLLWELDGFGLGILEPTGKTKKFNEDGTDYSIEYQKIVRKFLGAEAHFIGKEAVVEAEILMKRLIESSRNGVSKMTQDRIDDVEEHADDEIPEYVRDAKPRTKARAVHDRDEVETMVEDFPQMPATPTSPETHVAHPPTYQSSIDDEQELFTDF